MEQAHIALTLADMVLTIWVLVKARHTRHIEDELGVHRPVWYKGTRRRVRGEQTNAGV